MPNQSVNQWNCASVKYICVWSQLKIKRPTVLVSHSSGTVIITQCRCHSWVDNMLASEDKELLRTRLYGGAVGLSPVVAGRWGIDKPLSSPCSSPVTNECRLLQMSTHTALQFTLTFIPTGSAASTQDQHIINKYFGQMSELGSSGLTNRADCTW